jgi:hypothetical protein
MNLKNSIGAALFLAAAVLCPGPSFADDLSAVNVFPNPARVYQGNSRITFANVPAGARIRIFNLQGGQVRELQATGASLPWTLSNEDGQPVASGVYFYLITDDAGNKKSGKIAVLR